MAGPKKESRTSIDAAQESVRIDIIGIFTNVQKLSELVKSKQPLTKEQLGELLSGLEYLNDRYTQLNENIKKTQNVSALALGDVSSVQSANALFKSIDGSTQKLNQVNQVVSDIEKEVKKFPMLTGKVPAGVSGDELKKQVESLNKNATDYYTAVEKLRRDLKKGYSSSKSEPTPVASPPKLGKG